MKNWLRGFLFFCLIIQGPSPSIASAPKDVAVPMRLAKVIDTCFAQGMADYATHDKLKWYSAAAIPISMVAANVFDHMGLSTPGSRLSRWGSRLNAISLLVSIIAPFSVAYFWYTSSKRNMEQVRSPNEFAGYVFAHPLCHNLFTVSVGDENVVFQEKTAGGIRIQCLLDKSQPVQRGSFSISSKASLHAALFEVPILYETCNLENLEEAGT